MDSLLQELLLRKKNLEKIWRKILYPHGLAPPYIEKNLPYLIEVIAKEKGIDINNLLEENKNDYDDDYDDDSDSEYLNRQKILSILINKYHIKIEGKYEILVRQKIEKLHKLGILHGDLHSKNIVWYQNEPVFIDFEHTCYIDQISDDDINKYNDFGSYNGKNINNLLKSEMIHFNKY